MCSLTKNRRMQRSRSDFGSHFPLTSPDSADSFCRLWFIQRLVKGMRAPGKPLWCPARMQPHLLVWLCQPSRIHTTLKRHGKTRSQASNPFQKEPVNSHQAAMVPESVQIGVASPTGEQRWVLWRCCFGHGAKVVAAEAAGLQEGQFWFKIRNAIQLPDSQKRIITLPLHGYHAV